METSPAAPTAHRAPRPTDTMALSLSQNLKLSQNLVITVQLQQAIKLLQLSHQELVAEVNRELAENPTLEEIPDTQSHETSSVEAQLNEQSKAQKDDFVEQNNGAESDTSIDWEQVVKQLESQAPDVRNAAGPSRFDDLPPIETNLTASASLQEHLIEQLGMQVCTDGERRAAAVVILNLDHRGYLMDMSLEEIAEEAGVHIDDAEGAVMIVQEMDPIGCGASTLEGVLAVQAKVAFPEDPYIVGIIEHHLKDLEARNYLAVARDIDQDVEDVVEYHKMIRTLEPWPGRAFSDDPNQYITPDIDVVKIGGEWKILQNEDGLPRLRVSPHYRKVLLGDASSKEDKNYIKERLDSADFLIKSIFKRQRTIHRVMNAILAKQQDFFEKGHEYLRPMVLRDIAEEIEVHESTVSRVTTNKYVQTPHGILELKYFFNAGIQRNIGSDLASESVKMKIKKLVNAENAKKPLSDSALVKLLAKDDIKIARRTVAKYREQLGILSSSQRKQLF